MRKNELGNKLQQPTKSALISKGHGVLVGTLLGSLVVVTNTHVALAGQPSITSASSRTQPGDTATKVTPETANPGAPSGSSADVDMVLKGLLGPAPSNQGPKDTGAEATAPNESDQAPAKIFESIIDARMDPAKLAEFKVEAAQPGKAYLVLYDGVHSVIVYADPDASEGDRRFYMVHLVAFAPDVNPPKVEVRLVQPSGKDTRIVGSVDVTPEQLKAFDSMARDLEQLTQDMTFTWRTYDEIYDQVISLPGDLGQAIFQNCNATSAQLWYDLNHRRE